MQPHSRDAERPHRVNLGAPHEEVVSAGPDRQFCKRTKSAAPEVAGEVMSEFVRRDEARSDLRGKRRLERFEIDPARRAPTALFLLPSALTLTDATVQRREVVSLGETETRVEDRNSHRLEHQPESTDSADNHRSRRRGWSPGTARIWRASQCCP